MNRDNQPGHTLTHLRAWFYLACSAGCIIAAVTKQPAPPSWVLWIGLAQVCRFLSLEKP